MRLSYLILALILIGVIGTAISYYYVRILQLQQELRLEENVKVMDVEIDRKNDMLLSVTLLNEGETLAIERARLVKIQTMLTVAESKYSPPITLYKGDKTKIPLAYPLDREGADYFLYLFTNKGTVVICKISYPYPIPSRD